MHRKALILIGHIPSEQPGMEDATQWLKALVTEVPVTFVGAKDPFWKLKVQGPSVDFQLR